MTREEILKNLVEKFYEDFNECERAQHLLDCEYCELYKKYGRCHLGEYITGYQMPIIKKHETDLLKEFVEWLKGIYAKDYDDKGKIADKSIGRDDKENFWYMNGQQTALQRIIDLLDQDLEKFLKERK